jgi:HAD superfamily hydrolase (TIGR01509 family)
MKTNCIIFDLDGVIINSDFFTVSYCRDFNVETSVFKAFFETDFKDCLIGKSDLKEVLQKYLKNWNWNSTVDEFLLYWFNVENKPNNELINLVDALKQNGIRSVIGTNQEKYRTQFVSSKIGRHFAAIYASYQLQHTKPQEEYFIKLLELEKTKPENCIFIDDSIENINSANKLGITSFLYESNKQIMKLIEGKLNNY